MPIEIKKNVLFFFIVTKVHVPVFVLKMTNEPRQANLCLRAFRHDKL